MHFSIGIVLTCSIDLWLVYYIRVMKICLLDGVIMRTDEITIHVSPEVAKAYLTASLEDRREMELLANLQLTEFLQSPESVEEIMAEMSREARDRGLTFETLDSILND
jgi:hypothetical protein